MDKPSTRGLSLRFAPFETTIFMAKYLYYVYIMASSSGTLYIGMTNNLERRVIEHREGLREGFSKRYSCNKLVYLEEYQNIWDAKNREREIKKWRREKKENLIKQLNPHWKDLSKEWLGR